MGLDTSAHVSCSTTLNGELFVFGGSVSDEGLGSTIKQVIFRNNYPQIRIA